MIKKKLLCVLLALCLMVSPIMSVCVNAAESNDIQKVSLSLYSNLTSDKYISGLYKDNVFYITTENLCKLTGAEIVSETAEEVRINLSKGMRQFCVDVGSGNMQEILETEEFNITMPSLFFEDKVYISAIHFLRYMGATVQIQEDSDCQFMVIKRYDIFDAWADYVESDYGNFFWWDEIHIGNGDIESELTKAGVIALINRDSNVFRMMFDAEGIEQEALEDALLSIVKNEGQSYFVDESPESELIGTYSDLIGAESDWFGLITEAYSDGSDELAKQIGGLAESAAVASGFASNVVEAFEGLKQFDNMSTAQKNLLEKTILTHSDDSETLCDGWNVVYDAAYNINGKIQSEYDAQYKAALDASEATAYDFLNGATSAAGANPVSIAWSGVNLLTKLIPYTNEFIENETQLYNSYNCSIIQLIAREILSEAVLDWYYNNGMISNSINQIQKLEASKYAMILQLKSTITTRECLLTSGYLNEDDAAEMRELNRKTANLLNRTESCKITGVNLFDAEYDEDISWIKNYTNDLKLSPLYAEIIEQYITSFPWNSTTIADVTGFMEASYLYYYHSKLAEVGYAQIDIDKNGQKELLIGEVGKNTIYDLYTIKNDEVIHLGGSGERFSYMLCSDGSIIYNWSGSAVESGDDRCLINSTGDALELDKRVTYDAYYAEKIGLIDNAIEANADECYFVSESEDDNDYKHISAKQAREITDIFYKHLVESIVYIPFSEYNMTQDDGDEEEGVKSSKVDHIDFKSTDWGNQATITAYDKSENKIWQYDTPQYEPTELPRVSELGRKDEKYYLVQDGTVVALDIHTGTILWENRDFKGSGTGIAFGEDALYLCGQYGPNFYAVSYDGKTLCRIEQFDATYYWAKEIKLVDGSAAVYLYGGTTSYNNPVVFYVDLNTYAVER